MSANDDDNKSISDVQAENLAKNWSILSRPEQRQRLKELVATHRYQLTSLGRRVAVLVTKTYGRVLAPGLGTLHLRLPEDVVARSALTTTLAPFRAGVLCLSYEAACPAVGAKVRLPTRPS